MFVMTFIQTAIGSHVRMSNLDEACMEFRVLLPPLAFLEDGDSFLALPVSHVFLQTLVKLAGELTGDPETKAQQVSAPVACSQLST